MSANREEPLIVGVKAWLGDDADESVELLATVKLTDKDEVALRLYAGGADGGEDLTIYVSRAAALELGGQLRGTALEKWARR